MARSMEIPNKKRLEKTIMEVSDVFVVNKVAEGTFKWTIANFNSLKKKFKYWNKIKNCDWTFTITKESGFYSVTICTNYNGIITCFVCYNEENYSNPIIANKSTEGLYNFTFPDRAIHVSQNMFINKNRLVLAFKPNKNMVIGKPKIRSKVYDTPTQDFFPSMYQKFVNTSFADFVIYVKPKPLKAHKAILASRSSYFRQYIQEKCRDGEPGEIEMDATTDVICSILTFIYEGLLVFECEEKYLQALDLLRMLGILHLQLLPKTKSEYYGH